jgi:hypothetical protein
MLYDTNNMLVDNYNYEDLNHVKPTIVYARNCIKFDKDMPYITINGIPSGVNVSLVRNGDLYDIISDDEVVVDYINATYDISSSGDATYDINLNGSSSWWNTVDKYPTVSGFYLLDLTVELLMDENEFATSTVNRSGQVESRIKDKETNITALALPQIPYYFTVASYSGSIIDRGYYIYNTRR